MLNSGCFFRASIDGLSSNGNSLAPIIDASQAPLLDVSLAPLSVPEGYPYFGKAELKHTSGLIVYSLESNTCSQLVINSTTGILSGDLNHIDTQTCSYKVKATLNGIDDYVSDLVTLNFTPPLNISFSVKNETLKVGDTAKSITLSISPAPPFGSQLSYQLISLVGLDVNLVSGFAGEGTISVESGMTTKILSLQVPNSVSLASVDYQSLTLKTGTALSKPQLDLSIYKNDSPDFVQIEMNSSVFTNACGLTTDGKVYCWGSSSYGEFATGQLNTIYNTPTQLGTSTTWDLIDMDQGTVCGIDAGRLFCWGNNSYGQVGNGSPGTNVTSTYQIGISNTWTSVSTGLHTCGINNGELFCWGYNGYGQIGGGTTGGNILVPTRVGSLSNWTNVSVGTLHTCGIESGELYCWGRNNNLQLGIGLSGGSYNTPRASAVSGSWQDISSGEDYACGIRSGGVYCWGNNMYGATLVNTHTPTQVGTSLNWTKISSFLSYNCGLNGGQLYCWGSGFGNTGPVLQDTSSDWTNIDVSMASMACGIKNSKISCLGYAASSPVGDGHVTGYVYSPINVGPWTDWSQIHYGQTFTCGLRTGSLYCWGDDSFGGVGNGSLTGYVNSPQKIGLTSSWSKLSVGSDSACAIQNTELYCWGYNSSNGSSIIVPTRIGTDSGWTEVSVSQSNICGIKNGELFCWLSGAVPAQVGSSNQWSQISLSLSGNSFRCGIDGGKLFCWGSNGAGQLGLGYTSASVASPTQVGTATNWTYVFASRHAGTGGSENTCGIRAGELYCWGNNANGKNANGLTSGNALSPTKVGALTGWTKIEQSKDHSCGLESGRLFCWGNNQYGQVGNGSTSGANVLAPTQVGTSTNYTDFTISNSAVLSIDSGQLKGFGTGFQFKMDRSTPIQLIEF